MNLIARIGASLALLTLTACASGTVGTGGVSSAPIFGSAPSAAWDTQPAGRQWTAVALAAIDRLAPQLSSVTPTDIDAFCPGYRNASPANRRAFYVSLLAEIAKYESNFDPTVRFTETAVDSRGQRIVSRGLLQLSQESANGYGCAIASAEQLHDPTTNLECGVRIVDRWLTRDQVVAGYASGAWRGASRYWSVLRDREKLADIQTALNAKPYCARR